MDEAGSGRRPSAFQRGIRRLVVYGVLAAVLAEFWSVAWWIALIQHWTPHLAVVLLVLMVGVLRGRPRWLLGLVLAVVLRAAFLALPCALPPSLARLLAPVPLVPTGIETAAPVQEVRLFNANLFMARDDRARPALEAILADGADVVTLQEITEEFVAFAAATLDPLYPHRLLKPAANPSGIGVYSRWPLGEPDWLADETAMPQLVVPVIAPAATFVLACVHVMPGLNAQAAAIERLHLAALERRIAAEPRPLILAGDLNATPWSPRLRRFLAACRLHEPRAGRGFFPTWPDLPGLSAIGLPIDHVLVTGEIAIPRFERGPRVRSDHRPLSVTAAVPGRR